MKITKVKTNKGIFIFWDTKTNTPRLVAFGDPKGMYEMFVKQSPIVYKRLKALNKEHETKEDLEDAIEQSRSKYFKDNFHAAYDDEKNLPLIEFSYKIIQKPKKKWKQK